jgi:hypothetical protein
VLGLSQIQTHCLPPVFDCLSALLVMFVVVYTTSNIYQYWQLLRTHTRDSRLTHFVPNHRTGWIS